MPNITIPRDPFTLGVQHLTYADVIDGVGAAARAMVQLGWQTPPYGQVASFEVQLRDDNAGDGQWLRVATVAPPHVTVEVPLPDAGIWSLRVRCLFVVGGGSSYVWQLASVTEIAMDRGYGTASTAACKASVITSATGIVT